MSHGSTELSQPRQNRLTLHWPQPEPMKICQDLNPPTTQPTHTLPKDVPTKPAALQRLRQYLGLPQNYDFSQDKLPCHCILGEDKLCLLSVEIASELALTTTRRRRISQANMNKLEPDPESMELGMS